MLGKRFIAVAIILGFLGSAARAIEITDSTLPGDTTLKLKGSVSCEVKVAGTTEQVATTYAYLVYVTGSDIYHNQVYFPVANGTVTVIGQREVASRDNSGNLITTTLAPTTDSFRGTWVVPNDGTLHGEYRMHAVIYNLTGSGATATAVLAAGGDSVANFPVVKGGSGYDVPPSVVIVSSVKGEGSGAAATASVTGGVVDDPLKLIDGGSGYKNNPPKVYLVGAPWSPTTAADLGKNVATEKVSGLLTVDVLPDLAVGVPGSTYQAGSYRGADIIQFNNTWYNNSIGEGTLQSRPLRSVPADYYVADLRLTTNPEFGDANNDDFLLSRLSFAGDVPAVPDGTSILRHVTVTGTPEAVPAYGLTGISGTKRVYTPQPDDGYLDIGEQVTVSVEQMMPENYSGRYFVALRTTMSDAAKDARVNNTFVSNSANKIEILETGSPTIEPASAVSTDNGTFVQNGYADSDFSSVSEDGNSIAFTSKSGNLLIPPNLTQDFIQKYGSGADITQQNDVWWTANIKPYITSGQQVFIKFRQTREVLLASRDATGSQANADCFNPSISSDGRYVAYNSKATNLLQDSTGSRSMIYVFDAQTLGTKIISRNTAGRLANGDCFNPQLSQSGRFVVFESIATNLDPKAPASNSNQQIYIHDRDTDGNGEFDEEGNTKTYLVSINKANEVANGGCQNPVINLEDTKDQIKANGGMLVAFTSYARNMTDGATGNPMVYRVTVDPEKGPLSASVIPVSVNDIGDLPAAVGVDPVGNYITPFADEAAINGDGSQIAFTSSANNFVFNPRTGDYVPTFPNNNPNNPYAPVDTSVVPAGDYNRVPDVFIRNLKNNKTVRVSVSQPRVATGTITFSSPNPVPGNIPVKQPKAGESVTINDGIASATLVFGTDVAIGATVFKTRDNLVDAINARGLNILCYATNPPNSSSPGTGFIPSIFLWNSAAGDIGNRAIVTDSKSLLVSGMAGGGTQADDDAMAPGNTDAAPIQGVPFGSNQPSIDREGRRVAFRSIATNLDVHVRTDENKYPTSPHTGELIRPLLFRTSNVYVHDRRADSDPLSGFDAPLNTTTKRVSLNKFGYKTLIDYTQQGGLEATKSANSSSPAISANGRFVSFSSDSSGEGGLVFGPNNLTPLDEKNVRDVFIRDDRGIGDNPSTPESRPTIELKSPQDGLRVPPGSVIAINAKAEAKIGKSIASVQLYINGAAYGAALVAEPFAWTYTLPTTGTYYINVVVTDSRGITAAASRQVTAVAPTGAAPVVTVTQPSGVRDMVLGSEIYFNMTATDNDGSIKDGSAIFYVSGQGYTGTSAGFGNAYVYAYRPDAVGSYSLIAAATDNNAKGNTTVSMPQTLRFVQADKPLPVVEILGLVPGAATNAGGTILLRAEVQLFGADPAKSTVQFYADGVYLGDGVLQTDGTYAFNWKTPTAPRAYQTVRARVVAPNVTLKIDGKDTDFYASVFSTEFITINTSKGVPPLVSMVLPANGASAPLGQPITLRASASGSRGVASITVNNVGSGYTNTNPPTITIGKPGVTSVTVNNGGSGYASAPAVAFSNGGGSGAAAVAVLGTGANSNKVVRVDITANGTGYTNTPSVTFNGGGGSNASAVAFVNPAEAVASVVSNKISRIDVVNSGSGYTNVPTVEIESPPAGGTNATATAVVGTPTVASVQFYVNGTPIGAPVTSQPYQTTFTPASQGSYILSAVAKSTDGLVSDPDGVVVVTGNGLGPIITNLIPSSPGVTYIPGSEVPISAEATPQIAGARIASVQFFVNGESLGVPDTLAPFSTSFVVPGAGDYTITVLATDSFGNTGSKSVTIKSGASTDSGGKPIDAPFININYPTPSPVTLVPGSQIYINASAIASTNGPISKIKFYLDGAPKATITTTNTTAGFLYQQTDANDHTVVAEVEQRVGTNSFSTFSPPLPINAQNTVKYSAPTISLQPIFGVPTAGITAGTTVFLVADVNARQQAVLQVDYYADGIYIGTVNNPGTPGTGSFRATLEWAPPDNLAGKTVYIRAAARYVNDSVTSNLAPDAYSILSGEKPLKVIAKSSAPTVSFLSPGTGSKFAPNAQVVAAVQATAAAGRRITKVDFYLDGKPVFTDTEAPFIYSFQLGSIGDYDLVAVATDSSSQTKSASTTISASPPAGKAPSVLITQPLGEIAFVFNSQMFLNMQASDSDGTIKADSPTFYLNGQAESAESAKFGNSYTTLFTATPLNSVVNVAASASDNSTNVTVAPGPDLYFVPALNPLPSVEMLEMLPQTPMDAGGAVTLRARAVFPATANQKARVEFYANGAYVGTGTVDAKDPTLYTYIWKTPATTGSYLIKARAVALNWATNTQNNNQINYYGSVISENSVAHNTAAGSPPIVAVTNPAKNQAIPVGQPVNVTATAVVPVTVTAPSGANGGKVTSVPTVGQAVAIGSALFGVDVGGLSGTIKSPVAGVVTEVLVKTGATIKTGQALARIQGTTTSGGTISRVEFYANGELIGTDQAAPYTVQFTPPSVGTYNLSAIAYSNAGLVGVSPNVPVSAILGQAPVVALTTASSASAAARVSAGKVLSPLNIVQSGSGYVSQPAVTFVGGGGTGAVGSATLKVASIAVTSGGSGYSSVPTVTLSAPPAGGVQATARAVVNSGVVTQIVLTQAGSGYTSAPTVTISGGGGSSATARAVCGVDRVTVTNGGSGYSSAPYVVIAPPPAIVGGTETLVASATDKDGSIASMEFLVNGVSVATLTKAPYTYELPLINAGIYNVVARATDNVGNVTDSNLLKLTVQQGLSPVVAIVSPTNGTVVAAGKAIPVVANASDPDGSIASVAFYVNNAAVGQPVIQAPYETSYTPTSPGNYTITAVAIDSSGNRTQSAPVTITVPITTITVAVTKPANAFNYTVGTSILLEATASTTAGATITGVQFLLNGVPYGSVLTSAPYTTTLTPEALGTYTLVARATDSSGNSAASTAVRFTVTQSIGAPPTVVIAAPTQGTALTAGSSVYLNYTAVLDSGVGIASAEIYVNGKLLPTQRVGSAGVDFSARLDASVVGTYTAYAVVRDTRGNTSSSGTTVFTARAAQRQAPIIDIQPYESAQPLLAVGEPVTLRAKARFFTNAFGEVEFYANGVLLGTATAGTTNADQTVNYSMVWVPDVAGTKISLTARAVGVNFVYQNTSSGQQQDENVYASVISANTTTPPVTGLTINEVAPGLSPATNGGFIVDMYQKLLYRPPTYPEWLQYDTLMKSGFAKSDVIVSLMGYDTSKALFARNSEYNSTVAVPLVLYGRLSNLPGPPSGPPNQDGIVNFVSLLEANNTTLPLTGTYGGIAGAPWRATKGMATAMQSLLDSAVFRNAYPTVANMSNRQFVEWLEATVFPGRRSGGNSRNSLVAMMDSYSLQSERRGAALAFQSEYVAAALSTGLASGDPGGIERLYQRQIMTTALKFQLGIANPAPLWNKAYGISNPYNKAVVTTLLSQGAAPAITNKTFALSGKVNQYITPYQVTASNNPSLFKAVGLPSGLSINQSTGLISGIPLKSGTFNVTLTAANWAGTSPAKILVMTVSP